MNAAPLLSKSGPYLSFPLFLLLLSSFKFAPRGEFLLFLLLPLSCSFGLIPSRQRVKKESAIDLNGLVDKAVKVKFIGGREVTGVLKGHDPLLNIVLDETVEAIRGLFFLKAKLDNEDEEE